MIEIVILILGIFLLSMITTTIGLWLAYRCCKVKHLVVAGLGFSTGIMLAISFFGLIPEAVSLAGSRAANIAILVGFFTMLLFDFLLPHMHVIEEKPRNSKLRNVALMVAIGLSIHDFPEGFAISSSFIQQSALGLLVLISVAIHDVPERFATAVPLVLSQKKSFVYKMAFMTAFAEPVGAVIGAVAIAITPGLTPLFLAFAAGAMIFICLDELVPLALGYKRLHYFIAGVGASLVVYFGLSFIV